MVTRRVFLKYLAGLGAGLLPWYGWPEVLKNVNSRVVQASIQTRYSVKNETANSHSTQKIDASYPPTNTLYLQRTAMDDIVVLAQPEFQGRRAGSAGEEKAAAYLVDQMQGLGLKPLGDLMANQRIYDQAFTIYPVVEEFENFYYGRHLTFALGDPNGLRTPSANILGALMGTQSNESVILSAHYDHMGIFEGNLYPGANDNASGVGCILGVMRRFAREGLKPKRNVVLAFWGAEEMGFVGSSSFIKNPTIPLRGIQAVFNADTVGNGPLREFALWANSDNKAVQAIQSAAAANKASAPLTPNHGYNSDQFYFNLNHIPAVTLMAHNWLDKNHTPEDVPSFVSPQKIALAGDILYKAVHGLAF